MARRLKEREDREREERERLEQEKENLALVEKQDDERRQANSKLPPGVLTPLLARHRDLDEQLRARLAELEDK